MSPARHRWLVSAGVVAQDLCLQQARGQRWESLFCNFYFLKVGPFVPQAPSALCTASCVGHRSCLR